MNQTHAPTTATNITHQYDDNRLQPASDSTIAWDDLLAEVSAGGTFWLTTVDTSSRPHMRPVFAVRSSGVLFVSGRSTRWDCAVHVPSPRH